MPNYCFKWLEFHYRGNKTMGVLDWYSLTLEIKNNFKFLSKAVDWALDFHSKLKAISLHNFNIGFRMQIRVQTQFSSRRCGGFLEKAWVRAWISTNISEGALWSDFTKRKEHGIIATMLIKLNSWLDWKLDHLAHYLCIISKTLIRKCCTPNYNLLDSKHKILEPKNFPLPRFSLKYKMSVARGILSTVYNIEIYTWRTRPTFKKTMQMWHCSLEIKTCTLWFGSVTTLKSFVFLSQSLYSFHYNPQKVRYL